MDNFFEECEDCKTITKPQWEDCKTITKMTDEKLEQIFRTNLKDEKEWNTYAMVFFLEFDKMNEIIENMIFASLKKLKYMNLIFALFKKLKKHEFSFCKLKKAQKT